MSTKVWVPLALGSSIFITISLYGISKGSDEAGPFIIFYQSVGAIFVSLIYNLYKCCQNYRYGDGRFWNDQNFIKNGEFKKVHLLGFICFSCVIFINQNMNNITIWTANLANINSGVVTVIWSVNPVFQAIVDYCFFGERLKYNDYLGLIMMVACSILLSLQQEILKAMGRYDDPAPTTPTAPQVTNEQVLQPWVSVLCGCITPIFFTLHNIITRWVCFEKYGICFDGMRITITSYLVVFSVVLLASLIYWNTSVGQHFAAFDPQMLIYGSISSVFRTVAIVWLIKALTIGPQAIVSAIALTSNLFFVVVEAVRLLKVPNFIEFICLFLGFGGFFELVMPELIEYLVCCQCFRKKQANRKKSADQANAEFDEDQNVLVNLKRTTVE